MILHSNDPHWQLFIIAAAVVVAMVVFILSYITAHAIPYEGGNDRSFVKRRIWWIIWTVMGAVGYLAFYIFRYSEFQNAKGRIDYSLEAKYVITYIVGTVIVVALSAIVSLVVMRLKRNSKFGSILGRNN